MNGQGPLLSYTPNTIHLSHLFIQSDTLNRHPTPLWHSALPCPFVVFNVIPSG